jgi:cytoskeleton protein RodZ
MTDIGPTLREARLRDGWDINEVEERTKIRAKYLRALENEEWSLLPGPTYTKGFLRTYAEALGLDWRLLVDEYKREWEAPHEPDQVPVRPTLPHDPHHRRRRHVRRWAGALALIVVLAVGVDLIGRLGSSPKSGTPPATHLGSSSLGGTSSSGTGRSGATTATVSCVRGAPNYVAADCVALRIASHAAGVWACVVGDGRLRVDAARLGLGARTATFHARRFVVTLGSAAVTLVIDGHRVVPPAAAGAIRYVITPGAHRRTAAPATLRCVA